MFDLNSLPISGGIVVAAALWAGVSAFALGPLVASRTIATSGWSNTCEADLRGAIATQVPKPQTHPTISCADVLGAVGNGANQLCDQGGDLLFKLLTIDPLAAQKEQLRRRDAARLTRIAELAPSRCSCASRIVASDRLSWGLFAGSGRLIGGPVNLQSDLTQALHSPICAMKVEATQ